MAVGSGSSCEQFLELSDFPLGNGSLLELEFEVFGVFDDLSELILDEVHLAVLVLIA